MTSFHHISHGTLGIAAALAAVGGQAGRPDLVDLALAGTADVVSRNELGPSGFLVPHSDPQHRPDRIERYSYGWCHGPAGDAQVFRMLGAVTRDPAWPVLADRCWHTVTTSGLPRRIRPGFWDNNGRCCGTAGVLALACDRHAEAGGDLSLAARLAGDLAARAGAGSAGVLAQRGAPDYPEPAPAAHGLGHGQRRNHPRAAAVLPGGRRG